VACTVAGRPRRRRAHGPRSPSTARSSPGRAAPSSPTPPTEPVDSPSRTLPSASPGCLEPPCTTPAHPSCRPRPAAHGRSPAGIVGRLPGPARSAAGDQRRADRRHLRPGTATSGNPRARPTPHPRPRAERRDFYRTACFRDGGIGLEPCRASPGRRRFRLRPRVQPRQLGGRGEMPPRRPAWRSSRAQPRTAGSAARPGSNDDVAAPPGGGAAAAPRSAARSVPLTADSRFTRRRPRQRSQGTGNLWHTHRTPGYAGQLRPAQLIPAAVDRRDRSAAAATPWPWSGMPPDWPSPSCHAGLRSLVAGESPRFGSTAPWLIIGLPAGAWVGTGTPAAGYMNPPAPSCLLLFTLVCLLQLGPGAYSPSPRSLNGSPWPPGRLSVLFTAPPTGSWLPR
jgi:hypothetical protein